MTTGVTSQATNNPEPPRPQNSPEQNLRSQKHEAGLDEQLSARRRLQPPRCGDRVRDEHPERECPERVRNAGRSDRALLRQDVSQHGEGEQRRESTQVREQGPPVERTATPSTRRCRDPEPAGPRSDHRRRRASGRSSHRPWARTARGGTRRRQQQATDPHGPPVLGGEQGLARGGLPAPSVRCLRRDHACHDRHDRDDREAADTRQTLEPSARPSSEI